VWVEGLVQGVGGEDVLRVGVGVPEEPGEGDDWPGVAVR